MVGVRLQPDDVSMTRLLGTFCESSQSDAARNWRVFDWPAVVGALIRVKHQLTPLAEGRVVIDVMEARLAITVSGGEASCIETVEEPDLTVPTLDAHRLLFGPPGAVLCDGVAIAGSALSTPGVHCRWAMCTRMGCDQKVEHSYQARIASRYWLGIVRQDARLPRR